MRVLFIGNSYTFFNDMPGLFARECGKRGVQCSADSVTSGGYTLAHFVSENNEYGIRVRELLRGERYDYVVLQEQSVRPASHPGTFLKSVRELVPMIRENGASPVLYETWGRADGADVLEENGWDHETMQEKLTEAYEAAAAESGALGLTADDLKEALKERLPEKLWDVNFRALDYAKQA